MFVDWKASLLDADIGVIRQLLTVNEQMEEIRWQRKFGGGSPWTPSTLLSGSCTADIESVDYDPDLDPINPLFGADLDPTQDDVRRHVINGCFGDDVTDDVFQNDETLPARHTPSSKDTCVSSELRFKVTPSGLKVNSPDKVNRSKVEVIVKDPKSAADDSKTAKVEFRVNSKVTADGAKVIGSHAEVKVNGVDEVNEKLKTTKVEFKVDGAKSVEVKPPTSSQVQIRFLVNSDDAKGEGHLDGEGHSKVMAATESPCQAGAAHSIQHAPHASRDVKPSSGPMRKQQRIANEANREMRPEHGPQLRVMNLGQGIRSGHAGNTTPAKVRVTPFSVAGDHEETETVVVHL